MTDIGPSSTKSTHARALRPERIDLGDDVAVRNDVIAKEQGASERAVNRDDAKGAPFMYFAGVKYRPEKKYRKFLAGKVQTRRPATPLRLSRPPSSRLPTYYWNTRVLPARRGSKSNCCCTTPSAKLKKHSTGIP
jgi:hypothetical protein